MLKECQYQRNSSRVVSTSNDIMSYSGSNTCIGITTGEGNK